MNKPVFLHCGFDYVPGAVVGAQMSIKYAAAALLLDGEVGPDQFMPERIHREDIKANLGKISVIHDPGLDNLVVIKVRASVDKNRILRQRPQQIAAPIVGVKQASGELGMRQELDGSSG